MNSIQAWVTEVILDPADPSSRIVKIACAPEYIPEPGQYIKASFVGDGDSPLGITLFASGYSEYGFVCRPPASENWQPGAALNLSGPYGHGFNLPAHHSRLALVSLSARFDNLIPLADRALKLSYAVTLFGSQSIPQLSIEIEAYPLEALPEMLSWADLLAIEAPRLMLNRVRPFLGLDDKARLPVPAQILIETAMPCAGIGDCGACAIPLRHGWVTACRDGPVFNLEDLEY